MQRYNRLLPLSLFVALALMSLLAACGNPPSTITGSTSSNGTTTTGSTPSNGTTTKSTPSTKSGTTSVPLQVTKADITLSVPSVSAYTCGTTIKETYTATFSFPANNTGGSVHFDYTTNNGRSSSPATFVVNPGQTTYAYTFSWSGLTDNSNTVPGPGGVMVTTPNAYTSNLVAPTGACKSGTASVPLQVTKVAITLSIPSVSAYTCGKTIKETYTATFSFPANNTGGSIHFDYTTNNGRSSSPATFVVNPGQTKYVYTFSWSGSLDSSNTVPGPGGVMVTTPNAYTSNLVAPTGACTSN